MPNLKRPFHRLEILLENRSLWHLDIHIPRWRRAIVLPASDRRSFHPSLVYAIAAIATSLCVLEYQPYVDVMIDRAWKLSNDCLAFGDRVEDWIYAQILLIWHSSRCGHTLKVCNLKDLVILRHFSH